jgi:hypothetical protein
MTRGATMFANNKDCRQYQYGEQPEISSLDDLFTLYGPCGFYGVSAKVVSDLASGLDKSVRLEPTANQEILGDFDLTFTGFSLLTAIRPGSLSLVSRSSGGLSAVTNADDSTLFKSKGVDVVRYDENGVQMLESLKMPIGYTSSNANDVVVKSELTAVAGDVTAVEQEVDAIQANYAKTDEENTFSETQTFAKPIENVDTGIKHNFASFRISLNATPIIIGAPEGWTIAPSINGVGQVVITHNLEKIVYATADVSAEAYGNPGVSYTIFTYSSVNGNDIVITGMEDGTPNGNLTVYVQVAY